MEKPFSPAHQQFKDDHRYSCFQILFLVRSRQQEQLDPWLQAALGSGIPDLRTFAEGLQREYDAIKAALTYPYSTGPVEGQVNRLKLIKRIVS